MAQNTQPNFSGGELTEALGARVDLAEYNQSVKVMKNMFCHIQGGFSNRAGTAYLENFADTEHRFIKFQFSVEQAYALVFINLKMFILKDGAVVEDGGSPVEVITPWVTADLAELAYTQSADVLYVVHPDYPEYEIARTSHVDWTVTEVEYVEDPYAERTTEDQDDTFTIGFHRGDNRSFEFSEDGPLTSDMVGGTLRAGYVNQINPSIAEWGPIRIDTYTDEENGAGDIVKNVGVAYIKDWDFSDGIDAWYLHSSASTTSMEWDPVGGRLLLTAVSAPCEARTTVAVAPYRRYTVDVSAITLPFVGGAVTLNIGSTAGASDIYSVTLTSVDLANAEFSVANVSTIYISLVQGITATESRIVRLGIFGDISATKSWRVPAFRGAGYYPGVVSFFEQRKVLGGSDELPQTLWHSRTGGYYDFGFSTPLVDDDVINYTLAAAGADGIKWITPLGELIIGTSDGLWKVSSGSQSNAMTPLSIDAKKRYRIGCAKIEPIVLGKSIFFIERGASSIEQVIYSSGTREGEEFQGFSITDQAIHLFKDKTIINWTYVRKPDPIIYCVLSDGTIAALTVSTPRQIYGWHRHETEGNYKNVIAIPGDTRDDVYFVVERTIEETSKYYTEHLQPRITDKTTGDWWMVDSGLKYSGSPATVVSGLDHLDGETVTVLADGGVQSDQVVVGGEITIDNAASLIIVGLRYDQEVETLNLDLVDGGGSIQGRVKNVPKISLKVLDTRGFEIGTNEDLMEGPRLTTQIQGEGAIDFISGNVEIPIDSAFKDELSIFIKNSDPIPLTILSIIPEIRTIEDESQVQQ